MVPNRATHHKLDIEEAIELNHLLELDEDEDEQLVDLLFLNIQSNPSQKNTVNISITA